MVTISILGEANESALNDVKALLQQLHEGKPSHMKPDMQQLKEFVSDKTAAMIVAKDGERIVGMAILFILARVGEVSGHVDDVVVDSAYRGQGIATQLMEKLISVAREKKLRHLYLTSRPSREAANHLYQKLGFEKRETNPYRLKL